MLSTSTDLLLLLGTKGAVGRLTWGRGGREPSVEETRARWGVGTLLQIPPHSLNPGAAVGGVAKGKAVPPVPGDRTHRLDSVPQKSQHSYYSQELSTVQPRTMSWTLPGEKSLSGSHWLPSSLRFLPGPCNQGVGIWEPPPPHSLSAPAPPPI